MEMKNNNVYFGNKKSDEKAGILLGKSQTFFNTLLTNSYIDKIRKMYRAYYGNFVNEVNGGHEISYTGEQGELVVLPVNHFRNLAMHMYTMITANRPTMEARSVNTDYKSLAQAYLGNSVLDYYMREKRLEDYIKTATEMAIVLGAGFVKMTWNSTAGEIYETDEESGQNIYEGELEFANLSPLDVVVDGTKEQWSQNEWVLVRSYENRYNLMAKYPEMADKIKGLPSKSEDSIYKLTVFSNDETDDIPIYEFYHKKTEAMPDGNYMLFLDNSIVLLDTAMPYRQLPVFRIVPSDIMGTPYGYSPMFDVFPIQEGINSLYSAIMTNQNAFMVQNVFVPRGADLNVNSLEGAMNVIEGNAKPEALNLTSTPPEVFQFLQMLIQSAETISGVNSVARGNPEASLKSGTALALVQSMALQFISGLQQSYVKLIESIGTALINNLKAFSTAPKVIALVGKNNRPYLKEFTGDDISSINRVIVDIGNPLSRTTAGRVQMAEQLLQMKLLKTPEQYFQIINTGKLEAAYEGEMNELLLIKSENERFLEGETPIVSPLDAHRMHITEHKSVLADPDVRRDPVLVKSVLDHIEEHVNSLRNTDPDLLALIGEQALPPIQANPVGPEDLNENGMTQATLKNSPMQGMMNNPNQLPGPGQSITGQATPQGENLPNLPKPPPPFDQLPVTAQQNQPN